MVEQFDHGAAQAPQAGPGSAIGRELEGGYHHLNRDTTAKGAASHPPLAEAARAVAAATVADSAQDGDSDAVEPEGSAGTGATKQELFLTSIRTGGTGGAKAGRSPRDDGAR